jgi:hypothetical protein
MRNLLWLVPVAVFFLNPNLACSDEPQFQYGAAEMRAAVEGDWVVSINGLSVPVSAIVHVDQSATAPTASAAPAGTLLRAAHACGTRTLIKGAGACIDLTEMPLTVTFVSGDDSLASAPLSGTFTVFGLTFVQGNLSLTLGEYKVQVPVNAADSHVDAEVPVIGQAGLTAVVVH